MNRLNKDVSKFRLDGQAALITGATRGIGWEIARGMAESGSTVYVNGRDKKVLAARCKNLIDLGYDAKLSLFDATNIETINKFLDSSETPIDIFVNNAAVPGINNIAANSSNPVISFPNPLPEPAGTGVIITSSNE